MFHGCHIRHYWPTVLEEPERVYMIRLKISNNLVFLATNNGVYRSTDLGETWESRNTGLGTDLDVLSIAPTRVGNIVFAGTVHSLYKSTDNGDSWVDSTGSRRERSPCYGRCWW